MFRTRLIERLDAGLHGKLTLISAPAGFGKTTLLSAWIAAGDLAAAWLSLEEADGDPVRFLTYLVAALQTAAPQVGAGVLAALHSSQPPLTEWMLTGLLNEIALLPHRCVLVLDGYHVIDNTAIDQALTFLIEHLPPALHLVITTREAPLLPLARLRVRGQLTELRAADLRFTPDEAAEFLNEARGLKLPADTIAALEARTEGWIAGLQLAALSLHGHADAAHFVQSFTGSHRFGLDYVVEEVLQQQPEPVRRFLLQTAILDRLCGPSNLCRADGAGLDLPGVCALVGTAATCLATCRSQRRPPTGPGRCSRLSSPPTPGTDKRPQGRLFCFASAYGVQQPLACGMLDG